MGEDQHNLRIDKWLHHTRVFKTRSLAAQACTKGNVKIQKQAVKPSRLVRVGDELEVARGELLLALRVAGLPLQRIGPPRVAEFLEDLTPPERYAKAAERRREQALQNPHPHETLARPDKKQMRQLREWLEGHLDD